MRRDKLHPSQIPDDAIIASKIADNAVTNAKLANDAVNTSEIVNDAVTTAKVLNDNITYAKIQNVSAASRVVGRGSAAGAGDAEELTPTGNLAISGTNITVTDPPTFAGETLSNDLVFSADKLIRRNTSDASDNGSIELNGGGATGQTRGGMLRVYGNEAASVPGWVRASIGNVASSSFVVERADGNEVVNISGADGITALRFAATQVASANANTLDDYEEGTYTPKFHDGGGNDATHTVQNGVYVKIGQMVYFSLGLTMATKASMVAGNTLNFSLPFTIGNISGNGAAFSVGEYSGFTVGYYGAYAIGNANSANGNLRVDASNPSTGNSVIQVSHVNTTFAINIAGCYRSDA